ncbi:HAD-IA family hydrolase [Capnocytophaga sp. 051621]|uniref:HAD-IA family hydrolase n=2 Tax=Capnocytophaga TaxID=1016 RepID=A0ABS1YSK9_9FLAO|nr:MULTISPECIES: HAD-IA family hydrolase [Capnocytophaga]MBI1646480.1 HAD-IA family hydrolase [Capnocytophaga periodontitidis]MBM0649384.1 HAD-IA family hydrolase [Capnocytophaga genosp. AHN8471]MBM0661270.1 HAD-IA family hydrolase [Capnocytophaga genosp. AHN8471]
MTNNYIIFDMDGVLLDSEPMHQEIIYETFQLKGIPFDKAYIQTLTGMSAFPMWEKVKRDAQRTESVEELMQFHRDYFFKRLPEVKVPLVPHVKEVLEKFKNEGKHLSLASSSGRKLIDIFTQQTNIAHYFEVIMSGDDVQYSKPNPEIFLKVAQWYHLPATQFTVIEDSTNGVKAAKSANMQCIALQNPLSGGQDLSQADLLIHSMQELL